MITRREASTGLLSSAVLVPNQKIQGISIETSKSRRIV
jgi:hypothetical protein